MTAVALLAIGLGVLLILAAMRDDSPQEIVRRVLDTGRTK